MQTEERDYFAAGDSRCSCGLRRRVNYYPQRPVLGSTSHVRCVVQMHQCLDQKDGRSSSTKCWDGFSASALYTDEGAVFLSKHKMRSRAPLKSIETSSHNSKVPSQEQGTPRDFDTLALVHSMDQI